MYKPSNLGDGPVLVADHYPDTAVTALPNWNGWKGDDPFVIFGNNTVREGRNVGVWTVNHTNAVVLAAGKWSGLATAIKIPEEVDGPLMCVLGVYHSIAFEGKEGDAHVVPVIGNVTPAIVTALRGAVTDPILVPHDHYHTAVGSSNDRLLVISCLKKVIMDKPSNGIIAGGVTMHAHSAIGIVSVSSYVSLYAYTEQIGFHTPLV